MRAAAWPCVGGLGKAQFAHAPIHSKHIAVAAFCCRHCFKKYLVQSCESLHPGLRNDVCRRRSHPYGTYGHVCRPLQASPQLPPASTRAPHRSQSGWQPSRGLCTFRPRHRLRLPDPAVSLLHKRLRPSPIRSTPLAAAI